MELAGLYVYAWLIGAVPTAYIFGRLAKGIDIRKFGSGNVGGANVFQNVGKSWAFLLGFFEIIVKGSSPVWIGLYLLDLNSSSAALIVVPILSIAGHNWSVFLKFAGGRGVAVATGALLAVAYLELIVFLTVAIGGWAIFRSSGLWVYIALLILPISSFIFGEPLAITWLCLGILALITTKRLTSNWTPLPKDIPKRTVFLNRLLKDRDVSSREEWLNREPRAEGGSLD